MYGENFQHRIICRVFMKAFARVCGMGSSQIPTCCFSYRLILFLLRSQTKWTQFRLMLLYRHINSAMFIESKLNQLNERHNPFPNLKKCLEFKWPSSFTSLLFYHFRNSVRKSSGLSGWALVRSSHTMLLDSLRMRLSKVQELLRR